MERVDMSEITDRELSEVREDNLILALAAIVFRSKQSSLLQVYFKRV